MGEDNEAYNSNIITQSAPSGPTIFIQILLLRSSRSYMFFSPFFTRSSHLLNCTEIKKKPFCTVL